MSRISAEELFHVFETSLPRWFPYMNRNSEEQIRMLQQVRVNISNISNWIKENVEDKSMHDSELDIEHKIQIHGDRLRAFIETFTYPMSDDFRAAVYIICEYDWEILEISLHYLSQSSITIDLSLKSPPTSQQEGRVMVTSTSVWDMELLRHLIFSQMDDKPVVFGYFSSFE